jgi:hypothetical protein
MLGDKLNGSARAWDAVLWDLVANAELDEDEEACGDEASARPA